MDKEFLNFHDLVIKKQRFHSSKSEIPIEDINLNKVLVSREFPCKKNVLCILLAPKKNEKEVKLFCVLPPKMSRYVKISDDAKTMLFLFKDDKLLTKYNKIQNEVKRAEGRKKFSRDQVFGDKYLKRQ